MNLFDHYNPNTDYDLASVADFKAIPDDLKMMYTVTQRAKFDGIQIGTGKDCHELLVDLEILAARHGLQLQFAPDRIMQLRSSAADKLIQAGKNLWRLSKKRYGLRITDAYRPIDRQRLQFETIRGHLVKQGLTGEALDKQTTQLIADPDFLPPHTTGGTVDVTLFDLQTGEPLWLGTPVDAIDTPLIHTWHCDVEQTERDLRVILYGAMVLAGFINFPLEWWHYSYGDLEWALHHDQTTTIYDAVETLRAERIAG